MFLSKHCFIILDDEEQGLDYSITNICQQLLQSCYLLQSSPITRSCAQDVWNWLISFPPRSWINNTVFAWRRDLKNEIMIYMELTLSYISVLHYKLLCKNATSIAVLFYRRINYTWTPANLFGPRNVSHSSAIVSQCHSKRWTMPARPDSK